jgi:hypothetical protein
MQVFSYMMIIPPESIMEPAPGASMDFPGHSLR